MARSAVASFSRSDASRARASGSRVAARVTSIPSCSGRSRKNANTASASSERMSVFVLVMPVRASMSNRSARSRALQALRQRQEQIGRGAVGRTGVERKTTQLAEVVRRRHHAGGHELQPPALVMGAQIGGLERHVDQVLTEIDGHLRSMDGVEQAADQAAIAQRGLVTPQERVGETATVELPRQRHRTSAPPSIPPVGIVRVRTLRTDETAPVCGCAAANAQSASQRYYRAGAPCQTLGVSTSGVNIFGDSAYTS